VKEKDVSCADATTSVAGSVEISGRGFGYGDIVLELGDKPGGRLEESSVSQEGQRLTSRWRR
jgi:hypothetical protein